MTPIQPNGNYITRVLPPPRIARHLPPGGRQSHRPALRTKFKSIVGGDLRTPRPSKPRRGRRPRFSVKTAIRRCGPSGGRSLRWGWCADLRLDGVCRGGSLHPPVCGWRLCLRAVGDARPYGAHQQMSVIDKISLAVGEKICYNGCVIGNTQPEVAGLSAYCRIILEEFL